MFHKPLKSFFRSITSNKRGAVAAVLLLAVFLVIVPTGMARAGPGDWINWVAPGAMQSLAGLLYYPLVWFPVLILAAVSTLANDMIQPIQITTSNTVQMGWGITRDFANMFFILILLGIALDYILMGVSFGVKKALPTFIAVALLINFSLPIAGVFIDFSNVFTSFFLEQIGGAQFSETFANVIGLPSILDAKTLYDAKDKTQISGATLTDILFTSGFLVGNIFILLALSLMFLIRTGVLMGLLVVLPLVLVIMPFDKSYWGKWSGMFLKYVMFAPAATFFLYLSMKIFEGNIMSNLTANITSKGTGGQGIIDQIVQYLVIWFFMGGSLVAANSFGVHGSGAALKMWNQGENWVKGKIKGGAWGASKKAYQYGRMGAEKAKADKALDKMAQLAGRIPIGGGWAARQLTKGSMRIQEAKKEVELTQAEKNIIEKGSSDHVTNLITSYDDSKLPEQKKKAAKMLALDKKRKFKLFTNGVYDKEKTKNRKRQIRDYAASAKDIDSLKTILQQEPELAKEYYDKKYEKLDEIDKDTGKTNKTLREQALRGIYSKINFGDRELDESIIDNDFIKETIELNIINQDMFKQAQRAGNFALRNEFKNYMKTDKDHIEKYLSKPELAAFRSWLKKTGAKDYLGIKYEDLILGLTKGVGEVREQKSQKATNEMEKNWERKVKEWQTAQRKNSGRENEEEEEEEE